MKNLIAFFVAITSLAVNGQIINKKDTLFFGEGYSRAIALRGKKELIIGTSKSGVLSYNLKKNTVKTIIPAETGGEFRDVIVDEKTVYACLSGDSGVVFKAKGKNVIELYRDKSFIDDIVLYGRHLVTLSDPIENEVIFKVIDTKKGWVNQTEHFKTVAGEAYYAASGTTAQYLSGMYFHVSGGPNNATFYRRSTFEYHEQIRTELPFPKAEGAGPFSIFMLNELNGVIVGGNYTKPTSSDSTSMYTQDGGKTWTLSEKSTNGYRSCVTGTSEILFACGSNGIDYSMDQGKNWENFDNGNFCAMLLDGNTLYATTNKGYVIRYELGFIVEILNTIPM